MAPSRSLIQLPIELRRFSLSGDDYCRGGSEFETEFLNRHGVTRGDCDLYFDNVSDVRHYSYRIIRVTLSLLEEIFDEDWFEPADGERDPEFYARLREAAPYYRSFERI
jgi:hypothetical protein